MSAVIVTVGLIFTFILAIQTHHHSIALGLGCLIVAGLGWGLKDISER